MINFTAIDLVGIFMLLPLWMLVSISQGFLLGYVSNTLGFRSLILYRKMILASMLGLAAMPVIYFIVGSIFKLKSVLYFDCLLILLFAAIVIKERKRLFRKRALGIRPILALSLVTGAWLLIACFNLCDIQLDNKLYISPAHLDFLKHIAVTDAICRTGVPPDNPMFFPGHSQPLVFYYYWHVCAAIIAISANSQFDGRASVLAGTIWTGLVFWLSLMFCGRYFRFVKGTAAALERMLPSLLLVGNLYILFTIPLAHLLHSASVGGWIQDGVGNLLQALLLVPHHVAASVAGILASIILLEATRETDQLRKLAQFVVGGMCLASTIGLSVYVAIGFIATFAAWLLLAAWRRQSHQVLSFFTGGIVGLLLTMPFLLQLVHGSHHRQFPLELAVRHFELIDISLKAVAPGLMQSNPAVLSIFRLIFLPLHYIIGFGFILIGTILYWRNRSRQPIMEREQLLLTLFLVIMLLGSFLRSTMMNNDFGWRVLIPAQCACLVWTAHYLVVLQWHLLNRQRRFLLGTAITIGICSTAYDGCLNRIGFCEQQSGIRVFAIRSMYQALNATTAHDIIIQHNPIAEFFGVEPYFGLYGHHQVVASDDHNGIILGPSKREYASVADEVKSLFSEALPLARIKDIASRFGISVLLVKDTDPIWAIPSAPLWQLPIVARNQFTRAVSIR